LSAPPPTEGAAGDLSALCAPLGLVPSAEQARQLHDFLGLLARWNGTYNLTAVRDPAAMRIQHLADCLAVIPPLARHANQGRLLDVGSGGGLPGVVIATLLRGWDVTCVDAVGKKAAFVRQVAGDLGLKNLHAAHARVEALKAPAFDVITSRAFATLADFVSLSRPLLAEGGVWLAMKGQRPDAEIAALPPEVEVFHVEQLHVPQLDAQRCLVWTRLRKTE
jgi:16S rRNA (guanine527-N7)-methyltransferase